jgi:hypothetical protein
MEPWMKKNVLELKFEPVALKILLVCDWIPVNLPVFTGLPSCLYSLFLCTFL